MRAVVLISLLALGESLVVNPKSKERELHEEKAKKKTEVVTETAKSEATLARDLARAEEDKTGGNEITKARMRIFGKKMNFKDIQKAQSGYHCQDDPSDALMPAKSYNPPQPSKKQEKVAGILYITLGGHRKKVIEKMLRKNANKTAQYIHEAKGPVKSAKTMTEFSRGKDQDYLNQQYNVRTAEATRSVYLNHMEAIKRVAELAKETTTTITSSNVTEKDWFGENKTVGTSNSSKTETTSHNKPFLILEDDADLTKDWEKKIALLLKSVPSDWDMLKVGYWSERRCADKLNDVIYVPSGPTQSRSTGGLFYQGNQGYLVRPESVDKIIRAMKKGDVGDIDGNFVQNSCRGGSKRCFKLYAASEEYMAVGHNGMGSIRSSLKEVKQPKSNPWKEAATPEMYPFSSGSA